MCDVQEEDMFGILAMQPERYIHLKFNAARASKYQTEIISNHHYLAAWHDNTKTKENIHSDKC